MVLVKFLRYTFACCIHKTDIYMCVYILIMVNEGTCGLHYNWIFDKFMINEECTSTALNKNYD